MAIPPGYPNTLPPPMDWTTDRRVPLALLAAALAASGALLLVLTHQLTFYQDTWAFLITRRDITPYTLLHPHNEHIIVIPVAIEQLILRLFGMSTARPEYVLLTASLLGTAYLLFVYVRRRVGLWLALFAAVLLLCLGPAWEVLLWPFEISFTGSVFFGIAMLLVLERDDRRGDVLACVFLVLSLGFSELAIPFVAAAAVNVFQRRHDRGLHRAYIAIVPFLLYVAWYIGWGHEAESHLALRNVMTSPRFAIESMAVAVGSLFGLGTSPNTGLTDPVWGRALLIVLVIAFAYRQMRKPGFYPGLWPVATAAAVNWFLTAFNQIPGGREPTTSRYQYAGVVFVLLILANLLKGVRVDKRMILIGMAVTAAAVGSNLVVLKDSKDMLQQQSVFTRSDTAAIEIAQRTVRPEFQLTPEIAGTPSLVNIYAGDYLTAVREYGSPAYSQSELATAPEEGRRQADIVLSQALPISTTTRPVSAQTAFPRLGRCVTIPGGKASEDVEVPLRSGVSTVRLAPGPEAALSLRRFAVDEFPVGLEGAYGNTVTVLRIPHDLSDRPWYLHITAKQPARVCD
jgi:hypothetical protein